MTTQSQAETSVGAAVQRKAERTFAEQEIVDLWGRAYPGRGRIIFDVLRPCHESCVRTDNSVPAQSMDGKPDAMSVAKSVYHWLVTEDGMFRLAVEQRRASVFRPGDETRFQWLDTFLKRRYPLHPSKSIPSECYSAMAWGTVSGCRCLERFLPDSFRVRLWESYMASMRSAVAYAERDGFPEELAYFTNLMKIWHSGCLPIGLGSTRRKIEAAVFIVG
jgi:hypothetical protein